MYIYLFSGKRKSGKDYLTDRLIENYKNIVVLKISAPIKSHFAKINGLKLDDLMSSSLFKEKYRFEMIKWSEKVRFEDPGVFCRQAVELYKADEVPIWIVSDVRRKTDIEWFKQTYPDKVKVIRVIADVQVREKRGFEFTEGVDDAPSECDLDDFEDWDWIIDNNDDASDWRKKMNDVLSHLESIH